MKKLLSMEHFIVGNNMYWSQHPVQAEHVTVSHCTPQDIRWVEIGKQQKQKVKLCS